MGQNVFGSAATYFTVFYYQGATGFYSPSWYGYPTFELIPNNLGQWEQQYPNLTDLQPGDSPQKDGVANTLKYLFDIDPSQPMTQADRAALPVLGTTVINGTTYLTLSYREYALETGITVNVQTSSDLKTWTTDTNPSDQPQPTGVVDSDTLDPYMQVQIPITESNRYIRLNVTQP
jgi:hypothetical protein